MFKYRVWDKENKRYLEPRDTRLCGDGDLYLYLLTTDNDGETYYCWCLVDKKLYDIEFYIGKKDKNGTEIYAGDIVKGCIGYFDYEDNREVFNYNFHERCFIQKIRIDFWAGIINTFYVGLDLHEPLEMEVIGNIHEHPELLEGEKCL